MNAGGVCVCVCARRRIHKLPEVLTCTLGHVIHVIYIVLENGVWLTFGVKLIEGSWVGWVC